MIILDNMRVLLIYDHEEGFQEMVKWISTHKHASLFDRVFPIDNGMYVTICDDLYTEFCRHFSIAIK